MLLKKNYNNIVVEIGGFITVWEDNFNDGEVRDGINEWNLEENKIIFEKLNKKTLKEIKKALFNKMNDELYKKLTIRKFKKYVGILDNRVCFNQYTNDDNDWTPSREDFREWKKGNINLYVQDINITLKINGEDVLEEDLEKIINL